MSSFKIIKYYTQNFTKKTVIFLEFLQVCFVINCLKNVIYYLCLRCQEGQMIFKYMCFIILIKTNNTRNINYFYNKYI